MKSVIKVLLIFSFNFLTCRAAVLYQSSDPGITILDHSNFTQFVVDKNTAIIVEFYNTWCGHCVRFAPIWKKFAQDISSWSNVVKVGVVDCAESSNVGICRQYNIMAYPSVRYFWHHYDDKSDISPVVGKIDLPDQIRHDFLDFLAVNWNRTVPKIWPNLEIINPSSASEWNGIAQQFNGRDILLIVEDENSYLGREVILDLSSFHQVVILRMNYDSEWIKTFNIDIYNIPYVLRQSDDTLEPVIYWRVIDPHNDLRKSLKNFIVSDYQLEHGTPSLGVFTSTGVDNFKQSAEQIPDDLYLSDLYRSLHYTLYNQIPLQKNLNSTRLDIIKRFVQITADHFPFDSPQARSFITMLSQWLTTKVHNLDADEYLNALTMFDESNNLPKFDEWKTCRGSKEKYRGYPCSLWLFWHTLTVDEYLQQRNDPMKHSQHKVLRTMKDYITNFFSCSDCARHFGEMATKMEMSLRYSNSSVLWLWQAHNQVNKRLAGDLTEDPLHKKVQYPFQTLCPSCWDNTGNFKEPEVVNFLLKRYKKSNIIGYQSIDSKESANLHAEADSLVSSHDDFNRSKEEWSWPNIFLSRLDISLCLILYMLTSFMLLAFCFVLSIKKRSSRKRDLRVKYPSNP